MKRLSLAALALLGVTAAAPRLQAASGDSTVAAVGQPAPDFTLKDTEGKEVKLSSFAGKKVVIEWFNPDCPFIRFAHTKGDLKDQGNRLADKGLVYLAINSNAPGREGHGLERNVAARKEYGMKYPLLLDEDGKVGKMYDARTTPHIYVIDEKGKLVYKGAIDNAPFGEVREGKEKVNYLDQALAALAAGKLPEPAERNPYGCSVKYAK